MSAPNAAAKDQPVFHWCARILFIALIIASPWPFGSVTPRAASILGASLVVLGALVVASDLLRGRVGAPPAFVWTFAGLGLVLFQQLPLPAALVDAIAPGVSEVYAPLRSELGAPGWHPLSIETFQSLRGLLQLLGFLTAFYLSGRLFRRRSDRHTLVYAIALLGVALSLFAVYQKARWGTVLYGRFTVDSATPFGPFVNHNHFAGFVQAAALVTLGTALGMARRHGSLALLLGGASAIMGIAHVLSHSRGGLLAIGAGLVVLMGLSRIAEKHGRTTILAAVAVVGLFLVLAAPSGLYDRLATLRNPTEDGAIQFRLRLWSDSFDAAGRSPILGTGLGTYAAMIPAYRTGVDETRAEYAESDWIQTLCETGLLGVVLVGAFLWSVARQGGRRLRESESQGNRGLLVGATAGVAALVVHGIYDFNLHIPSNALLFAVLMGLVAPHATEVRKLKRVGFRYPAGALTVVLAITAAAYLILLGETRHATRQVDPILTRPDEFSDVIRTLSRARALVPNNPETAYLLGRFYNEEAYRARDAARYRRLRLEQAASAFRDAVHLAPARGRYWFELAWTEANLGNHDTADRLFALAIERDPLRANLRGNYALYLASRGRLDEALDQIERGREMTPGLRPMDALNIIGPYIGDDALLIERAAGEGAEAESAISRYRSALETDESE